MKKQLTFLFFILFSFSLIAQENIEASDTLRKDALNVYMSADEFIKREIPYINYVRDLKDAQVYIISTSERTGSGGREYYFFIEGQKEFEGMSDTVSCSTSPDDTEDQIRRLRVNTLEMALISYVSKTPLAKYIDINFTQPLNEEVSTDKWDNWVFWTNLQAEYRHEETSKYYNINGRFKVSRVTEAWKFMLDVNYSQNINKYEVGDYTYTSEYISKYLDGLFVKSISNHWSIGGIFEASSKPYNNSKLLLLATPGIEFNIFPYSESNRRQFNFLYSAGLEYHKYEEVTIYDKLEDKFWLHSLSVSFSTIEKWGTFSLGSYYYNYLDDWSHYNLTFSGDVNFRVAKGLFFNIGGNFYLVPVSNSKTQFTYYSKFGISYTFGSIYNNVVNPRFR